MDPQLDLTLAVVACFSAAAHSSNAELACKPRPAGFSVDSLREVAKELAAQRHKGKDDKSAESPAATALSTLLEKRAAQWLPLHQVFARRPAPTERPPSSGDAACDVFLRDVLWPHVMENEPHLVLGQSSDEPRVSAFEARAATSGQPRTFAFHGTSFANVWSILSCGLVNTAQVTPGLSKNGSVYGKGIYLSTDPRTSYNYAQLGQQLPGLPGRWRCLLVCEVIPGPLVTIGGAKAGHATKNKDASCDVPESYIVVEDSDAVLVRRALFWRLPGGEGGIGGFSIEFWFAVILVVVLLAYTVFGGKSSSHYRRF